jgi:hypothetical protein
MKKKYSLKYKTVTVYFDKNPRTGICECCEKKFKTQMHHWSYKYKPKEVKENKELALENTTELCYHCHKVANAIRFIVENWLKTLKLLAILKKRNKIK